MGITTFTTIKFRFYQQELPGTSAKIVTAISSDVKLADVCIDKKIVSAFTTGEFKIHDVEVVS